MTRAAIVLCTLAPLVAVATGVATGVGAGAGCAPVEPPCLAVGVLADAPSSIALVEGGRGFLALRSDPRVTVRIDGLVAGFTARVREDGVHVVRAPYGITGTLPASIEATCDDGDRATAPLDLVIAPIDVATLAPIQGGNAPGPREAPGLAVVPAGVVVVGGVHEHASLSDAWFLARGGDTWVELDVALAPLVGAGSIRATPRDDGRVLLLGSTGATAILDVANGGDAKLLAPGGAVPAESDGASLARSTGPTGALTLALCGRGAARHCRASAFDEGDGVLTPWRLLEPSGFAPAGRDGAVVDIDHESRRLVLFGGQLEDGIASDAWTLAVDEIGVESGARIAWQHLAHRASGDEEPAARRGACGAVDPLGHRLLVVGGAEAEGPARGVLAFDLDIERESSFTAERPKAWRAVDVDDMPDGSVGCAAAWDPVEGRLVVGFGAVPAGVEPSQSLWALDVSP